MSPEYIFRTGANDLRLCEKLNYVCETVRDTDYDTEFEHRRFVESIGRADKSLAYSCEACPAVEITGLQLCRIAYGARTLLHVLAPALGKTVLVGESVFKPLHVEIAEMQQIKVLADMEVVFLYPMEA